MPWLLDPTVQRALEAAQPLTQTQIDIAMAAVGGPSGNADRVLVVSGDSATISVLGVMTSAPSMMAYYFGGGNTLYGDLYAAIDTVEMDPNVKSVDFVFNSGGGEAQPAVDLGDKVAAMKKPTRALVQTAASAAYWAASQADSIVAVSRASRVGSIGAATVAYKPSAQSSIDIASTNAPNKRPDPETAEGLAVIRAELDQFHDLFATAVAVGRDKSMETVNNTFGRGGMMLAQQALDAGMIDAIGLQTKSKTQAKATATATGATQMDLATLQAQHPALHAQVIAEGHKQGVAAELDRAKFHATMGKKTGATAIALAAISAGTAKDDGETMAEYFTCNTNNADLAARQADEAALVGNLPAAADEGVKQKLVADEAAKVAMAALGLEMGA
jgi:ClpP class serine protease